VSGLEVVGKKMKLLKLTKKKKKKNGPPVISVLRSSARPPEPRKRTARLKKKFSGLLGLGVRLTHFTSVQSGTEYFTLPYICTSVPYAYGIVCHL
jgi:hypothetical protein